MSGRDHDETTASDAGTGLRNQAARGVAWIAMSNWADELARVLVFVILSRLLDPEAFGLVALAWVFVGLAEVVAEQGLVDALVQRKRLGPADLDTAYWMSVFAGVVLALALSALALPLATALDQAELASVLVALSFVIPLRSFSLVQRSILMRDMAFRSLAVRSLVSVGVGSVIGVGAAFLGFGVWSIVAQRLATEGTATAVLWRVCGWRPRLNIDFQEIRELFGFGKHVVGFRLLNFVNANVDNLLIGAVLGSVSLGLYTVGYRILRLVHSLTGSLIDKVALPLFSRLQDEPDRFRTAYYKTSSFASFMAFPVFMAILVMAPEIVGVLFGPKWAESAPVMQVLALLGIVRTLTYLNSPAVTALGKPSWRLFIVVVTTALNVVAFLVAVQYGIVAVAIAATIVGYLVAPVSYGAVWRLTRFNPWRYLSLVSGPLVASILMAGTMAVLSYALAGARDWVALAVALCVGGVVYLVAVRLLARSLTAEVRGLVREILPSPALRGRVSSTIEG